MRSFEAPETSQFNQLVEHYYQPLFQFAARLCGSPSRAMVLTYRTFQQASDPSQSFAAAGNVRAWLFTLMFHHFLENTTPQPRA